MAYVKLTYTARQKKKSSTLLSLAQSELEAAEVLVKSELFREAVVHMYFTSYYISQSLLIGHLAKKTSHRNVEASLHKVYGRHGIFPRSYVDLHTYLHKIRTQYSYRAVHVPPPSEVQQKLGRLRFYVRYAYKSVPKVETLDLVREIYAANKTIIKDFSYDIYCPKTYAHHTRLTFWQPPFYLDIFSPDKLARHSERMLSNLKVKRTKDYVVGLNSRCDQYRAVHLLMLDIDTLDVAVEAELKKLGGVVLKSGRGFHFIANEVIVGQTNWEKKMNHIKRDKVLKKYVDADHIGISFRRGYSTLRITSSPIKPVTPVFYKEL